MVQNSSKAHPLMVIAATAVILTCLLAIGVMTGIIPSPLNRDRGDRVELDTKVEVPGLPGPNARSNVTDNRAGFTNNRETTAPPAKVARERAPERAPVGSTASPAPERTVVPAPAPKVAAVCNNCGTVTSVRAVRQEGEAGIVGPLAGGAIGGLVGSQIGGGSGKTIATVVGAAGGAAIGTEVERRRKSTTSYVVNVRLNDGSTRSFTYASPPGYDAGDRIRVVDGRLVRDS